MTQASFGPQDRFKINQPQVVFQTIDGEVIAIHMESGVYFSMKDTAAEIWHGIEKGASFSEIAAFYGESSAPAVGAFLQKLRSENLVSLDSSIQPASKTAPGKKSAPFRTPVLEKFDDMKEHIMADPIHEVDESGWPSKRRNNAGEKG